MKLPVFVAGQDGDCPGRILSVDGAWGAPGLNLSHWPGHATPPDLRHDLSTGCALRFARLETAERERRTRGLVAVANNHYDTDGICSLWTVLNPQAALERSDILLAAAAAGDFFALPSRRAIQIDAIVTGLADSARSPLGEYIKDLDDRERHEYVTKYVLDDFHRILAGDVEDYRELWSPVLDGVRRDTEHLEQCRREHHEPLDCTVWVAPSALGAAAGPERFDPGRHALFGSTTSDRVLVIAPVDGGHTYRFLIGTFSWFDLVTRDRIPRPDLDRLVRRLNEMEETCEEDERAWRGQDPESPSPEIWFGAADFEVFSERAPVLRPSRLAPVDVQLEIAATLRPRP